MLNGDKEEAVRGGQFSFCFLSPIAHKENKLLLLFQLNIFAQFLSFSPHGGSSYNSCGRSSEWYENYISNRFRFRIDTFESIFLNAGGKVTM